MMEISERVGILFLILIRHITLAMHTVRIMPARWYQQKIGLKYKLRKINETLTSAQYDIRSDREWLATAFIVSITKEDYGDYRKRK